MAYINNAINEQFARINDLLGQQDTQITRHYAQTRKFMDDIQTLCTEITELIAGKITESLETMRELQRAIEDCNTRGADGAAALEENKILKQQMDKYLTGLNGIAAKITDYAKKIPNNDTEYAARIECLKKLKETITALPVWRDVEGVGGGVGGVGGGDTGRRVERVEGVGGGGVGSGEGVGLREKSDWEKSDDLAHLKDAQKVSGSTLISGAADKFSVASDADSPTEGGSKHKNRRQTNHKRKTKRKKHYKTKRKSQCKSKRRCKK